MPRQSLPSSRSLPTAPPEENDSTRGNSGASRRSLDCDPAPSFAQEIPSDLLAETLIVPNENEAAPLPPPCRADRWETRVTWAWESGHLPLCPGKTKAYNCFQL